MVIRSDNGPSFTSHEYESYMANRTQSFELETQFCSVRKKFLSQVRSKVTRKKDTLSMVTAVRNGKYVIGNASLFKKGAPRIL